jgi:alkylation response protein AidB-like acyl-CoA dehydrogenase
MTPKFIQEFGRAQILPYQKHWDEAQALPAQLFEQLGKLGIMGSFVPKEYGGLGLNLAQYMTVVEEFAKLDAAVSLSLLAHNSLCIGHIMSYGSKAQQQAWLPQLTSGKYIGAWALTEPEAGSDVRNLTTIAPTRPSQLRISVTSTVCVRKALMQYENACRSNHYLHQRSFAAVAGSLFGVFEHSGAC